MKGRNKKLMLCLEKTQRCISLVKELRSQRLNDEAIMRKGVATLEHCVAAMKEIKAAKSSRA